jgi:hypothetical protein
MHFICHNQILFKIRLIRHNRYIKSYSACQPIVEEMFAPFDCKIFFIFWMALRLKFTVCLAIFPWNVLAKTMSCFFYSNKLFGTLIFNVKEPKDIVGSGFLQVKGRVSPDTGMYFIFFKKIISNFLRTVYDF